MHWKHCRRCCSRRQQYGCIDPAVSKSGLSHRMKKLEALADALRQRVEKGQEAEP